MTGIITGIKRMEIHDGDGIRTTVFFKGCPLKCIWCHNPEGILCSPQVAFYPEKCIGCGKCKTFCPNNDADLKSAGCKGCGACAEACPAKARLLYGERFEAFDLAKTLSEDKPFFDASGGGVTFSGGECLLQAEFALELAKELNKIGISVCIDTCGFVSRKAIESVLPYTDTFLYDIKAFDSMVHKRLTGKGNTVILDNLRFLSSSGAKIEIRIPLVKGYNDEEIPAIADFLGKLFGIKKVKVLRFHDMARSKYRALGMEDTIPHTTTTVDDVLQAINILKSAGLNAVSDV